MNALTDQTYNSVTSSVSSFVNSCKKDNTNFLFTQNSEVSPYALCFAIFCKNLIKENCELLESKEELSETIVQNLFNFKNNLNLSIEELVFNKPFMQLLTFSLSALAILKKEDLEVINRLVDELYPTDIEKKLLLSGSLEGAPQSGNKAMFFAILILHAQKYLSKEEARDDIELWIDLHLKAMNNRGFWTKSNGMSFLDFQNGFHQYEIFEYLGIEGSFYDLAKASTVKLVDFDGHFAPFPGGGGCYDYDAVALLCSAHAKWNSEEVRNVLKSLFHRILDEQNIDGGFCESHQIRPIKSVRILRRLLSVGSIESFIEASRRSIGSLKSKNSRIQTHWTSYSREWNESNLWDTWFRLMTIARIEIYFNPDCRERWGFIDYPGIGHSRF